MLFWLAGGLFTYGFCLSRGEGNFNFIDVIMFPVVMIIWPLLLGLVFLDK